MVARASEEERLASALRGKGSYFGVMDMLWKQAEVVAAQY